MKKRIAAVIAICAALVMIASAPAVVGDTHLVVKGDQGPNASAKSWDFSPPGLGTCSWHITNFGLRWLVIDVFDNTTGTPEQIMHQRIRFASVNAFPTGAVQTNDVIMSPTHSYMITVTPNGPKGSYCTVEDVYDLAQAPVPVFIATVDHMTVYVDGSGSSDPDGTVVSWNWDFGDGGTAVGATASHTYAFPSRFVITLTLMDNDGLTSTMHQYANIVDLLPVAAFTYATDGLTVSVDASGSSDDYGIVGYAWNWGDGMTGTGKTATHTYGGGLGPVATQVASDAGKVPMPFMVFGITYAPDGLTPLSSVTVKVTNMRTMDSVTILTDSLGYYTVDLNNPFQYPNGFVIGDLINVTGSYFGMNGWNQGLVDVSETPYLWLDVILTESGGMWHFPITLKVTDTIGQTSQMMIMIVVAPPPVASFTYTVSGATVFVDASGSTANAGIASYEWNWGDGTTSGGAIAEHTYSPSKASPATIQTPDGRPPGFPYVVFGYVYQPDGVALSIGASVVVTNLRSGFTTTMITDEFGFYQTALDQGAGGPPDSGGPMQGDPVNVTASKDAMIGWNEGIVDYNVAPYMWLNVVMSSGQPVMVFDITLTVTDTLGQTSSIIIPVTVTL